MASVKGAASRLVSWSPITTTSSAKGSAQRERTKLRVQGVLGQIADYSGTDWATIGWPRVDRGQSPAMMFGQGWIASEVLRWCLTESRSRAKSCNDVWPRVDRKQSPAMMLDQGWIAGAVVRTCKSKYEGSSHKGRYDGRLRKGKLQRGNCVADNRWEKSWT